MKKSMVFLYFRRFSAGQWTNLFLCLLNRFLWYGGFLILAGMLSSCAGFNPPEIPVPVIHPVQGNPPPGGGTYLFPYRQKFPHGFDDELRGEFPAINVSGNVADVCAAVAATLDTPLFLTSSVAVAVAGSEGEQGGIVEEGESVVDDVVLSFRGGQFADLRAALALVDVGVRILNIGVVCGGSLDWRVVELPPIAFLELAEVLPGQLLQIGDAFVLVTGTPAEVAVAVSIMEDLRDIPAYGSAGVFSLPAAFDLVALESWLAAAQLSDHVLVARRLVFGPEYALAAVRQWVESHRYLNCDLFTWRVRRVSDAGVLLGALQYALPDDYLCGGDAPYLYTDRGEILFNVHARFRSDLLATLHRLDPQPLPVVLDFLSILVTKDQRANFSLALQKGFGASDFILGSSTSVVFSVDDFVGELSAFFDNSRGSTMRRFSIPGVVGQGLSYTAGASVPVNAGAVIDDAGNERQELIRVNLGLEFSAVVVPVDGGYSLSFDVSIRGPGSDAESYTTVTRSGLGFLDDVGSLVLLSSSDVSGGVGYGFNRYSVSDAVSDVYLMVSIREGVFR